MRISISWFKFVFFGALFITLMNVKLFNYIYVNLEEESQLHYFVLFPVIYFGLLLSIFSLLFVRYTSKALLSIFILITFFSVYFMHSYGVVIDHDMIRNIVNTDMRESKELLFSWKLLILFVVFVCLPVYLIFKIQIIYQGLWVRCSTFLTSLFIAIMVFGVFSSKFIPFFRNHNDARMYNAPFYQIYSAVKFAKKELKPKEELGRIALDAKIDDNNKKLFVFVVGETARASNYSLGGYTNNDTNLYTKDIISSENGVFFDNVRSCGTATAISLPCMFSKSKREEYNGSEYKENVLDVLNRVGVNVSWSGNNSGGCQGVCDRLSNKNLLSEEFDSVLLDSLATNLQTLDDNNNLIVLHLQGSHGPTYYRRYPKEFEKFKPVCNTNDLAKCTKEELYNTYDNTILYTDFLLSKIVSLLQQYDDYEVAMLYVSDHGESLGENGIYLHGMPYFIAPEVQKHVPMIFWSNNEELTKIAKINANKTLSHDNIYSTLLGFFNVETKTYEEEFDILRNNT